MTSSIPTIRRHENSISVSRVRNTVFVPTVHSIQIGERGPDCVLILDNAPILLNTPDAVKIGYELCRMESQSEEGELIILTINGRDVMLIPSQARQVGGVLLKKADRADDWQRNEGKRI